MAWTKRRKHLSRAARAEARKQSEQRKREQAGRRPQTRAAVEPSSERRLPRCRDVERLAAHGSCGRAPGTTIRFRALLVAVLAQRPGLVDDPYWDGLYALAERDWLRDPALWRPRGRGLAEAFRSLAEHLHGQYPVSRHLWDGLMITDNYGDSARQSLGFISQVSCGVSPRSLVGTFDMPAPLTRRMLHLALRPPRPMSFVEATRRAQAVGYGGTEWLGRELFSAGLDEFTDDEPYWATVIHWFCRQERLGHDAYRELLGYLRSRHIHNEPVALKGRSLLSLRRDQKRFRKAEDEVWRWDWLQELAQAPAPSPCDIADYREGDWRLTRIRTARKLVLEGFSMHHCAGGFAGDQKLGKTTFWSLTHRDRRALTISVESATRNVSAIAGRHNRDPRREELTHVEAWARVNGVQIDRWLEDWRLWKD
jgi:hypothetical protein